MKTETENAPEKGTTMLKAESLKPAVCLTRKGKLVSYQCNNSQDVQRTN